MEDSRYDRQRRLQGWDQGKLLEAYVVVAGAGALGNELIKNLVLLGVGHLLIVDFDQIEVSNLSRTVLFRDSDVGQSKARVAARAAIQLNANVDVKYIDGNLFTDIGLGFYRHANIAVGCLDNLGARSRVGVSCALAGIPFLDGGMWGLGGEVRWFMPGEGPCFDCGLEPSDQARTHERLSCTGFLTDDNYGPPQATTAFTAAVIGGLLAQETVRYLCGMKVAGGEALVYNGMNGSMHRSTLTRRHDCVYHRPYSNISELNCGAHQISASELLDRAAREVGEHPILELGRDFLLGFTCETCDRREEVNATMGTVYEARISCSTCGRARIPEIISRIDSRSPYVDRHLSELGVPPGEILAVRSEEKMRLYELAADIRDFWA